MSLKVTWRVVSPNPLKTASKAPSLQPLGLVITIGHLQALRLWTTARAAPSLQPLSLVITIGHLQPSSLPTTARVSSKSATNAPTISFSDAQGDAVPKMPTPRPEGRLSEENEVKLTVKMHTTISPNHISTLGFGFEGSFPSTNANSKNGFEHKSATIAFTGDNIVSESFVVEAIDPSDEVFTSRISPQQVEIVNHQVGLDAYARLLHFHVVVTRRSRKRRALNQLIGLSQEPIYILPLYIIEA